MKYIVDFSFKNLWIVITLKISWYKTGNTEDILGISKRDEERCGSEEGSESRIWIENFEVLLRQLEGYNISLKNFF